jgi:aryl-alcohol dehydrogenase-like predicted oxidoreductase
MKEKILGRTGLRVSELSFGSLIFSKRQGNLTVEEGAAVVRKGFELGINLFDTATSYGTQGHLCEGLKGLGDKVMVSTKTHAKTRELAKKDFEASLQELGREYIDIYHLHMVDDAADLVARREVIDCLLEYKERGLIRAIGASVHKVKGVQAVLAEQDIDILFTVLNSRGLGIRDGSVDDMIDVCRKAHARGIGIMAMKPLGGGHLRKSTKEAFDFLRNLDLVDSICAGMKTTAEVEMNVRLFEGLPISSETLSQIETVARRLWINNACKGCGECVDACAQGFLTIDYSLANKSKDKKGHAVVDGENCILCGYCAEACPQFAIRVV